MMTIKLVGISALLEYAETDFVKKVTEKYDNELAQIIQGEWRLHRHELRLKLAELVRKELTVFEKEGSVAFIPQTIVNNGDVFHLYQLVDVEGENIALYNYRLSGRPAEIYLSSFISEAADYGRSKQKEQ